MVQKPLSHAKPSARDRSLSTGSRRADGGRELERVLSFSVASTSSAAATNDGTVSDLGRALDATALLISVEDPRSSNSNIMTLQTAVRASQ